MLKKTLLAAVVLGLAATAVQANDISGYATYSIGHAMADKPKTVKEIESIVKSIGGQTSADRSSTGHKVVVGFKVHPYIALEAQYIDLGSSNYKASFSEPPVNANSKINLKTQGFGGNVVGIYPIDDFTVFAKAGYHAMRTKASSTFHSNVASIADISERKTVTKWAPSVGIGASYDMTKELAVVAEYELYKGVANKKVSGDNLKHDVDFVSVGLRYKF